MFPAVWSNRHAVALILLIGILLTLPMLMHVAGLPPRDRVYSGIRVETGAKAENIRNEFIGSTCGSLLPWTIRKAAVF